MKKTEKILIVGHGDIAEKALIKRLHDKGFQNIISSHEIALDTAIQVSVNGFFSDYRPDYIFLFSVRSGGIKANQDYPADFFYLNSASQNNVIYAASKFETKKIIYFASSCIYPKDSPQPIKPDQIMTGPLEPTSAAYATAKLAGITLCQSYRRQYGLNVIVAIPATIYGPGCDVDPESSHVLGALIYQICAAKDKRQEEVILWGSGNPRREFIFSEDFADAACILAERYQYETPVNIGYGSDISINELALIIKQASGFLGQIVFDKNYPDGVMQKLLDSQVMTKLGFKPKIDIFQGVERTLNWYQTERTQVS